MKVLYIADQYSNGGASKALLEMIIQLRDKYGVEPIVGTAFNNALAKELDKNNIPHICLGHRQFSFNYDTKRGLKKLFFLRPFYWGRYYVANKKALSTVQRMIKKGEIDLVHSNVNRNDIGGVIARQYGVPHIWHIREFTKGHFYLVFNSISPFDRMNRLTDKYVAISNAVGKEWSNRGIDIKKIETIYDGVEIKKYPIKKEYFKYRMLKIVCVGQITEAKGQRILIEALRNFKKYKIPFIADFYGDGELSYVEALKTLVSTYNMNDMVKFKGYVDDIHKVLANYDIGINPSAEEGFGRTTVEYMASGLITIIKKNMITKEMIGDDEFGFSFIDSVEITRALLKIYEDKCNAIKMGKSGCKRARAIFDINVNIKRFYDLYLDIIRKNKIYLDNRF